MGRGPGGDGALSRAPPPRARFDRGYAARRRAARDPARCRNDRLDPAKDEIIELAMVPFYYSAADELVAIGGAFNELREPAVPIAPDVTG